MFRLWPMGGLWSEVLGLSMVAPSWSTGEWWSRVPELPAAAPLSSGQQVARLSSVSRLMAAIPLG